MTAPKLLRLAPLAMLLLAACDPEPLPPVAPGPPPAPPPPPTLTSRPEWHVNDNNPQNTAGAFQWDKLDPKFVASVAAYSKDVREVVGGNIEISSVVRCLQALADAVESTPANPSPVDVKAYASRIRIEATKAATSGASPGQPSTQKEAIKGALTQASTAFEELSRSLFAVPEVQGAARDLQATLAPITPVGPLASHQTQIYKSLASAEAALKAIQVEAAKRANKK